MGNEVKTTAEFTLVPTVPSEEDRPRERKFSWGHYWSHVTSCNSLCTIVGGLYTTGGTIALGYMLIDGFTDPDPDSDWAQKNHTFADLGAVGVATVSGLLGLGVLFCFAAGVTIKTCRDGIIEGRVQRGQTPLLAPE